MINYKKAKKILISSKINIKNEIIFAKDSINRVSAKNIYSPVNYPAGHNTAFDGYAIKSQETNRLNIKNPISCLNTFKSNNFFGLIVYINLIVGKLI